MNICICHLYPDLMNLYGDTGNVLCLVRRCQWRGINVKVEGVSLKDKISPKKYDLFFGGGGQDQQQIVVSQDLQIGKNKALKEAAEKDIPMLLICGTYQLFGHYFQPFQGPRLKGISLFDAFTVASKKRKIGNIVIQLPITNYQLPITTLVGFENHSGNTYIKKIKNQKSKIKTHPLGRVLVGFGNNGEDRTEGAVYKNVLGCYLHGSLLPKNPHLADFLIKLALKRKYGNVKLNPLDDFLEWQAHHAAIKKARQAK